MLRLNRMRFPLIVTMGIFGATLLCSGCGKSGPPMAPVRGTVTLNGEPLNTGTVTFIPDSGPPAFGQIQQDGTYVLQTFEPGDGAVLGNHRIMVMAVSFPNPEMPEAVPLLASKYSNEQTSGLTAEVKPEENTVNLDLQGSTQRRPGRR